MKIGFGESVPSLLPAAEGVHQFAHALKGPCATLGLSFMIKFSASLVADAEGGRWVEAAEQYRSLRGIFQQLNSQVGSLVEPVGAIPPNGT